MKKEALATFAGCPLLLQLWSYEHFAIGRPVVDRSPYPEEWYGEMEEDAPTMASLWCRRRPHWAHEQPRSAYEHFRTQFDRLRPNDVVWEPYNVRAVHTRAGSGLSPLCTRDEEYWLTKAPLVFDIYVEEYSPQRVMRQFGRHQAFPLVPIRIVPLHVRRL
ncbi:serine/threonine-protein phosphatase 7 long form homolog [Phragmites australis]|uniref:serine/threonine-protein phosphatase 7 long form homolog n=1 Tax=Phragmites australis TaxID=29695 RepID=UPI002D77BFE1|nr:serine/threonine-protein phosphatase 7 long form homolog [Phragmites australis]